MPRRFKVTRVLDKQCSSETALSGRKRLEVAYTLVVWNFGLDAAAVSIREPTPVSQDERVRVRMARPSIPPASDDHGVLTWEIPVEAGGCSEIAYGFTLEFLQEMSVATVEGSRIGPVLTTYSVRCLCGVVGLSFCLDRVSVS